MNRRADAIEGEFWADVEESVALRRYRALVNTVDDGIYQLDSAGRFVAVNDRIVELSGHARGDLLGEHVSVVLEDGDVERIEREIRGRLAGESESNETVEITARRRDGGRIPCELRVSLLVEDGTFEGTVGVVRDISDRKRAKRTLDDRERRLERERDLTDHILETSPVAIRVFDADGTIDRMNEHAREFLAITEEEAETYDPSDRAVYDESDRLVPADEHPFARTLKTGEAVYDRVLRIDLSDGARRWISVNAAPLFDEEDELDRVVTTGEDVTRLKERERLLKQRQDELAAELGEIYGRVTDGLVAMNREWEFTHVNDRAEAILGVDKDELLGREIWDAFPGVAGTRFEEQYREAMATQQQTSIEEYYPPHGIWYDEHIYPSETGMSIYFRDVTEKKMRERELELFRTLLDHSTDSVFVIDPDTGAFVDVNDTACRRCGYERPELLQMTILDIETEVPDRNAWEALVGELRAEQSMTADGSHRRKDGSIYPVEVNLSYVELDREYVLAMVRDVTELREHKRELEDAVERLKESNERLEQFAYAASHDLQEPLRMVSSYLQLIESRYDVFDEEGEEFLSFAVDGADRMREMVKALLRYSRVETRGDPIEPVELETVLRDATDDLRVRIEETGAAITNDELPRVEGDADQLRQVFQNLLDNAVVYSGDEPPRIHVGAARRERMWVLSVRDEGIGIDPKDQEHIFTIFNRLHSREEYEGTGIGLALCERIVERHGGDIWVDSKPGEGATFSFTLPAVESESA